VQVSYCPNLSYGQDLALDDRTAPHPCQNIVRTFRVFYDRAKTPGPSFGSPGPRLGPPSGQAHGPCPSCRAERLPPALIAGPGPWYPNGRDRRRPLACRSGRRVVCAVQAHVVAGQDRKPALPPGRSGRTRRHDARKPVSRPSVRRKGRPLMIAAATWLLTSTDHFRRNHCHVFARFAHSA
jgi:hypothetical protein